VGGMGVLVFFLLALAVAIAVWASGRRRCPNPKCRRARVPGKTVCPFCNTPYASRRGHTRFSLGSFPRPLYELRFVSGPKAGTKHRVGSPRLSIGRGSSNELVLEGLLISRNHAQIVLEDNRFVIYDRDSTNGTYVNGQRVAKHLLQSGDYIRIGPHVLEFITLGEFSHSISASHTPRPFPPNPPPPSGNAGDIQDYILTPFHSGGFATVYKAISRRDPHHTIAVKVLNQVDPYARDKFLQEGHLGKVLNHPNIVQVLGTGILDGAPYIMMEFLDGGTLRERITMGQPLPLPTVVNVAVQVCAALQYAHERKVVHRDIKPENIMFTSTGRVKVVDFGIARWATQSTETSVGVILGTPWYLAPEQAKGLPVDHRTDIYSFGVVLYEMLTGRVPFDGEDPVAVMHKHVASQPQRLTNLNPAISADVEGVVLRALAKDPSRRFSSAKHLSAALQKAARITPSVRVTGIHPPLAAEAPKGARLRVISGNAGGKSIPIGAQGVLLGRALIDPADGCLSRRHARIDFQGGHYWIEDLGSANGTWVNGVRVFRPVLLSPGAEIRVGKQVLRFEVLP